MSGDYCAVKEVVVTVQENGIIRGTDGHIIASLDEGIEFDSKHLVPVNNTVLPLYVNDSMGETNE